MSAHALLKNLKNMLWKWKTAHAEVTAKKKIQRGQLITEVLKQTDFAPLPFEEQVVVFYATLNGYFDDVPKEIIKKTEESYLDYLKKLHDQDVLTPIRESGDLTPEIEKSLKEAIEKFKLTLAK